MDANTKHVLAAVNRYRREIREPELADLPKGQRQEAEACPLKNALGASLVDGNVAALSEYSQVFALQKTFGIARSDAQLYVRLPMYVVQWVRDFDRGKYPEYVED